MSLDDEFRRIQKGHREQIRRRLARIVMGSSVARVFERDSPKEIWSFLTKIPVDELPSIKSQKDFKDWFERQLESLATTIHRKNGTNSRILPGYKWGHATKILCLYLRDITLHREYFTDQQVERVVRWLYVPLDSVNMASLKRCGVPLDFCKIKEIDTEEKFYQVQDHLARAADRVGVPRIWFDDNWSGRE
jgi:hypothetical protein